MVEMFRGKKGPLVLKLVLFVNACHTSSFILLHDAYQNNPKHFLKHSKNVLVDSGILENEKQKNKQTHQRH